MATRTRRRLSEPELAARRQREREHLTEAVTELQTSAGWERWVAVRRNNGLSRYSLHNQVLIAWQAAIRGMRPSYIAGYRW